MNEIDKSSRTLEFPIFRFHLMTTGENRKIVGRVIIFEFIFIFVSFEIDEILDETWAGVKIWSCKKVFEVF